MRAVRLHAYGSPAPLAIEEIPPPRAAAGELLVRVSGTSVNPVDIKLREGSYRPMSEDALPVVLGRDVAGTVVTAAGRFAVGDEVYGLADFERGTYADYVVLRPGTVAAKPKALSMEKAGTVPLAALTAWQGLFRHGGLTAGQRVLIHGGAGGVGSFAVQFARAKGADVVATASARDHATLHDIGAATTVDHGTQRFEDIVGPCDLILDLVGGETLRRSYAVLKPGGAIVSALEEPNLELLSGAGTSRGKAYVTEPDGADLAEIGALIDAGQVRVIVADRFDLGQIDDAHARLRRGGLRGKIAVTVAVA